MKKIHSIGLLALAIISCNSKQQQQPVVAAPAKQEIKMPEPPHRLEKLVKLEGTKDLVCGMPVSAGISDTFTYRKKLYGFCSAGCKDEFIKTPITYLHPKK